MIVSVDNHQNLSCVQSLGDQQHLQGDRPRAQQPFKADDRVDISDQARERFNAQNSENSIIKDEKDLNEEDKRQVDKLKKTDQEVRSHERAHMAAGSGLVMGGASYEYERGPDGKMYAVGGEVKIDTSRERDPGATIAKMQKVKRAALAPAQPSGQDRSVAAKASQIETEARIELQKQKSEASDEKNHHVDELPNSISTNPFDTPDNSSRIGHNLNVIA
jgi:SprA-related family